MFNGSSAGRVLARELTDPGLECRSSHIFFLQNGLSGSLISSAEMSDVCVPKFTSLVSARDYSPPVKPHPPSCGIVSLKFHK